MTGLFAAASDKRVCRALTGVATAVTLALAIPAAAAAEDNSATAAQAATPAPPAKKQPWTVTCAGEGAEGDLTCAASQTLVAKGTGQRVLTVSVAKADGGALAATLALPHGILLTDGVKIAVDQGQRTTFPITTADQNGSYATVKLDAAMLATMKRGSTFDVRVTAATGGEIDLPISLSGFSAAIAKL